MNANDILELANDRLIPLLNDERERLKPIDKWLSENPPATKLPRDATPEHKYLELLARTPWLPLVVDTLNQMLSAERVYSSSRTGAEMRPVWAPWERNRMGVKQSALTRAAIGYGLAYAMVMPGRPGAVITCHSPMDTLAVYGDVVEDEFPQYFLRRIPQKKATLWRVVDEEDVHFLAQENGGRLEYLEPRSHSFGYVPVVRYANKMDLEGRTPGDVERFIPTAARINKTDYDRLMVQHFNSWKVRTATGLDEPGSDEEKSTQKLLLRHEDVLTGGEGVVFGTLDETSLDPFVKAHDSDVETLAATSQTPTTAFGKLINVSAEGLVEARAALYAKRDERQASFGESHAQLLRVAADTEGRTEDAFDFSLKIQWADLEARTMSAAVDALGKAATMLGVPASVLWDRIPGVDFTTAESWRRHAEEHPTPDMVQARALAAQLIPTV